MEKGIKTILGLGFLAYLGWWLFKKPVTPQPTTTTAMPPVNTPLVPKLEPKYIVTEDVYFWEGDGTRIAFVIPKDTIVSGTFDREGNLDVVTSDGGVTLLYGSFQSVSEDTELSDKIMLGCFSYKVTNVNNTGNESVVNYVTCEGEPSTQNIYENEPAIIDNVIEGSMFSGDPKVLISKA
jgi:hypothetical protein